MNQELVNKIQQLNAEHSNLNYDYIYYEIPGYREKANELYLQAKELYPLIITSFLSNYEWLKSCKLELSGSSIDAKWKMTNINQTDFSITFQVRFYAPNPFKNELLTEQDKAHLLATDIKGPLYEAFIDDFINFARENLSESLFYPSVEYKRDFND